MSTEKYNLVCLYVDVLKAGTKVRNSGRLSDKRICIRNINGKYCKGESKPYGVYRYYREHYLIGKKQ